VQQFVRPEAQQQDKGCQHHRHDHMAGHPVQGALSLRLRHLADDVWFGRLGLG
jgi:hypothetical protein